MDTRSKIVPESKLSEAVRAGQWWILAGTFDPLTAATAQRIAASAAAPGVKLAVVVEPSDRELLAIDARAALVAALGSVDLVCIGPVSLPAQREPARDAAATEDFIKLVLERTSEDQH